MKLLKEINEYIALNDKKQKDKEVEKVEVLMRNK